VRRVALLLATSLLCGCVRDAVLENDVRNAQWRARTLATAADPSIAFAALSAQLVELEAIYQRAPDDDRVRALLARGYVLMARGFVELRRLDAVVAGDGARAEREAQLRADAERRARYYALTVGPSARVAVQLEFEPPLASADEACRRHDRVHYEQGLNAMLAAPEPAPEKRLEAALGRRLAAAWLAPSVAARCSFAAAAP
jgi:hypothetical protein